MVKATNPHTGVSEIVTPQQADAMRTDIATSEYRFENLDTVKPAPPPLVDRPASPPSDTPARKSEAK